jgi:hypothetical protein
MVSACATVVSGTDSSVSISTDPTGASCTITREGATLAQVTPTPGQVRVSNSRQPLNIACTAAGREPVSVQHDSEFTGATFGNILLGGGIGLIVDAASGANHKYPPSVRIELPPTEFASTAERDSFYERSIAARESRFRADMQKAEGSCQPSNRSACEAEMERLTRAKDMDLAAITQRRERARVRV